MALVVKTVRTESNRNAGVAHHGEVMVFVADPTRPGPFGSKPGTIGDEIMWRRTNGAPYPVEVITAAVAETLKQRGVPAVEKARFDRKAGCGMCPCSPGYILYTGRRPYHRISIWLEEVGEPEVRDVQ